MFDILHRVGINAKPETVFAALTTINGLSGWWTGDAKGEAAAGGVIDFGFCKTRVLKAEPGKLVHWQISHGPAEWLGTDVIFNLIWKDDQTFVLFKHGNWKEPVEFMHHCSTKWASFLFSLRDLVEKSNGHPIPHDFKIYFNEGM